MNERPPTPQWEGVKGVPGVFQGESAGRGENTITIRGSSRYQVGMYVDDIPVATAYRNEWNADNTLLFDLESVEISKGFSSPLLSSNNGLAGTINLRTAKPVKELDFKAKYMNYFDNQANDQGRMMGFSLGTRQELFYAKISAVENRRDHYRLSSDFDGGRFQGKGKRVGSDYRNRSMNAMVGLTPTKDIDVMFGYTVQRFERGQPINAAKDAPNLGSGGSQTRTWRWPIYDTDRYYMNADWNINEKAHVKFIAYYDKHQDKTYDYKDKDFTVRNIEGDQHYDQHTAGAQVKFDYTFNDSNKLATSVGYRELSHKGYRWTSAGSKYLSDDIKENYWDVGAEYEWKPIRPLTLVLGGSYTWMDPDRSNTYAANGTKSRMDTGGLSEDLFTWQLGAFYDVTKNDQVFATVARKSRIGTMRERFMGYRNNASMPTSADLKPEKAMHYELGYRGVVMEKLKLNTSVFFSDSKDLIISTQDAGKNTYFINADETEVWGGELGAELLLNRYLSAGVTYSYMHWDTKKSTSVQYLTFTPKHSGSAYLVISPMKDLSIIPELYFTDKFYSSSSRSDSNARTPGFTTMNLKAMYEFKDNYTVEVGVQNLFDKNYYYSYGYYQPGMTLFAGLTVKY
ncbi:TonB-dependent receptor [Oxalobacter vibrioformis]|uniref:TonB-dependent receptor n=1 Tax=Oxalobacter vibrioformis TaxID=933080 RepID=A0A9E9P3E1_9BURK|nr:TonB-dependent receptor [Oxalobacter vibrioformis]WAW10125.1 TonB-dependent receptor [Oxalobacter vibrioformis]